MTCEPERQSDEWFCASCGRRWAVDEDKPACGQVEARVPDTDLQLRIAKCIIGPRLDVAIGRQKMLALRDHKWSKMVSRADRDDAMNAAAAIMIELDAT